MDISDDAEHSSHVLELQVEDWDLLGGNDFMGRLKLPLEMFRDRKVVQRFYALGGPNGASHEAFLWPLSPRQAAAHPP